MRVETEGAEIVPTAAALRRAIAAGEFEIHYQPQIDLKSGHVVSAEALVRWRTDDGKLLPPDAFIPGVEKSGLSGSLTRWIMNHCLAAQRRWRRDGLQVRVAVNLSAGDIYDDGFVDNIARLVKKHQIDPSWLELELTESVALADPAKATPVLDRIRSMGISLALDDFGKRYSTLEYLRTLPFDAIKLDRSFVQGMVARKLDARIVGSVLDLASNLRLQVTAEGVETDATYRLLAARGCNRIQGFFVSPPLPERQFLEWLESLDSGRWVALSDLGVKSSGVGSVASSGSERATRVLVIEDHTLVRQSVVKAISAEPGFEVIGESDNGEDGLESGKASSPDLALLDIQLPGIDGVETAHRLRRENPAIRIVFLTMRDDDETILRAVEAGADGYVAKTASTEELIDAIQTVIEGGSYLSPPIANRVIGLARAGLTHRKAV